MAEEYQFITASDITISDVIFTNSTTTTTADAVVINLVGNPNAVDLSDIPERFILYDSDGDVVLTRGEVKKIYETEIFDGGYDYPLLDPGDCEDLDELDVCEQNLRKYLAILDLPGISFEYSDLHGNDGAIRREYQRSLEAVPKVRKDLEDELRSDEERLAEEEREEREREGWCNGDFDVTTGSVNHLMPCPIHGGT